MSIDPSTSVPYRVSGIDYREFICEYSHNGFIVEDSSINDDDTQEIIDAESNKIPSWFTTPQLSEDDLIGEEDFALIWYDNEEEE